MIALSGKKIDGWIVDDEIKRNEILSVYKSTDISTLVIVQSIERATLASTF